MTTQILETDYLIIGCGAVGMAFTDVLLTETNARIIIVDNHDRPSGHWNDSYPFVKLHQPSLSYGVNSRQLGSNLIDKVGLNKGFYELASGSEIITYFEEVMNQQFLLTGRVKYYPMCEYLGNYEFKSLITGERYKVKVTKKLVDATYSNVEVPLTHKKEYDVADGVTCIAPNELPHLNRPHSGYVIVGAGKTGVDTCIWLLLRGVLPADIQWIMPRDAWMMKRDNLQPGEVVNAALKAFDAIIQSKSVDDLFKKLDACSLLLRIDKGVKPTAFRGSIVSNLELQMVRQVKNIIRLGRVKKIEKDKIILVKGNVPSDPDKIYIDCSGNGEKRQPIIPVFDGNKITPQLLAAFQLPFSAALIAHVEAKFQDDTTKNQVCAVVPFPDRDTDWLKLFAGHFKNVIRWQADKDLIRWILKSRLEFLSVVISQTKLIEIKKIISVIKMQRKLKQALPKLLSLIEQIKE